MEDRKRPFCDFKLEKKKESKLVMEKESEDRKEEAAECFPAYTAGLKTSKKIMWNIALISSFGRIFVNNFVFKQLATLQIGNCSQNSLKKSSIRARIRTIFLLANEDGPIGSSMRQAVGPLMAALSVEIPLGQIFM